VLWSSGPIGETVQASGGEEPAVRRTRGRDRLFKWID
jgi:hypothetical protein